MNFNYSIHTFNSHALSDFVFFISISVSILAVSFSFEKAVKWSRQHTDKT